MYMTWEWGSSAVVGVGQGGEVVQRAGAEEGWAPHRCLPWTWSPDALSGTRRHPKGTPAQQWRWGIDPHNQWMPGRQRSQAPSSSGPGGWGQVRTDGTQHNITQHRVKTVATKAAHTANVNRPTMGKGRGGGTSHTCGTQAAPEALPLAGPCKEQRHAHMGTNIW